MIPQYSTSRAFLQYCLTIGSTSLRGFSGWLLFRFSRLYRFVFGQSGDKGFQSCPVLFWYGLLKLLFEPFFLDGGLPAGEPGAEVRAAPGFLASRIYDDMPIRCAYHAQQFTF